MYIQNQSFSDEETLIEQLFDFGIGTASTDITTMVAEIDLEVRNNVAYQEYRATISDEEEVMELDDDERRLKLAERLMQLYERFVVEKNQLFGVKENVQTLLYSMDLY
jgi:hypothetical protein